MPAKQPAGGPSIGKFDILATYALARALREGADENEAKQRGLAAAIMGAKARLARESGSTPHDHLAEKREAEEKKKTTITAEAFDKQVARKMGPYFDATFLPTIQRLVDAGLSYDAVKSIVQIPTTWGAKINGQQFEAKAREFLETT